MTVLVTGDLHLNDLPRDKYRHDFQQQLRALVKKHKVGTVVICGDLTDEKDYHPATLVNKVVDHIHELAQLCGVIIPKGNHDYSSLRTTPFFTFLKRIDNVRWINEPTWQEETLTTWPGKTLFLPHSPDPENEWAGLAFKQAKLIFAHQTFTGALSESGREMEGTPNPFPKGITVLSGDVHVPQQLGQITYIGAPYTIDFGDDYAPRMLLIQGKEITSIPCTGVQKRLIECRPQDLVKIKGIAEKDIVKLRLEVDADAYAHWGEHREAAYAWAAKAGVILHQVMPLAKKKVSTKKIIRKIANKSDAEIIKAYAERKKVDAKTLKVGQEFL